MAIAILESLRGLLFFSGNQEEESSLQKLKNELTRIESFLPSEAIKNFNPATADLEDLDQVYDQLACTFLFDKDVADHVLKTKGPFKIMMPAFQGFVDEAAEACAELAQLLRRKAPEILGRNLVLLWQKVQQDHPELPQSSDPLAIRTWLRNPVNTPTLAKIRTLDLRIPKLQVIPPAVLAFTGLVSVCLYESGLYYTPHVFDAHPNRSLEIQTDGLKAFEGLS